MPKAKQYRKRNFGKCFACFCKYSKCKASKHRIGRKQKKELKRFETLALMCHFSPMPEISICDLRESYKMYKKYFKLIPFMDRYKAQIMAVALYNSYGEAVYINQDGRLCFSWEYDNGLYTESGLMPFCYNKKAAGETWAYSEVVEVWNCLFDEVNDDIRADIWNDITLLEAIKKRMQAK